MGARFFSRFFYGFLFFLAMNVAHWQGDMSTAQGVEGESGDYEFSDLYGDPNDPTIKTTDQGITADPQEKATNDKIDAILNQFNIILRVNAFIGSLSPQSTAWNAARQKNLKSIIPTSLPVFNFTGISAETPLELLMLSNVAAMAFCKGKSDPTKRDLKHSTISGSIFKKGVQAGAGALAGNKQAFTLPPLGTGTATCANIRERFCNNVCTTGLCGADPLYGAVCIRACWEPRFLSNTKIQQCHQEFILRYVNNVPGAAANPCAIKKLQLERKGAARRFVAGASGEKQSYVLADQCVAIGSSTNAAALGAIGTLCAKLFQTCSLSQQDRQNLSGLLMQMRLTGKVPTMPVGVGIGSSTSPLLGALMGSLPPALPYGNVPPPGYPMPGMFPGNVPPPGYSGYPAPGMSPYAPPPVGNIQPPVLYALPSGGPMGGPMMNGPGGPNWNNGNNTGGGWNNSGGNNTGGGWNNGGRNNTGGGGWNNGGGNNTGGGWNNNNNGGGGGQYGQGGGGNWNGNNNGGGYNNGGGGGGNDNNDPCNQNSNSWDQGICDTTGNSPYNGPGNGGNNNGGGGQFGQQGQSNGDDPCDQNGNNFDRGICSMNNGSPY